jgi:hypothetical protein
MLRVWTKRIVAIAVIAAIVLGYRWYRDWSSVQAENMADRYALVTAHVWVASVQYRNNPGRFMELRDSILASENLSNEKMFEYLDIYRKRPEKYKYFTERVNQLVDSLLGEKQQSQP